MSVPKLGIMCSSTCACRANSHDCSSCPPSKCANTPKNQGSSQNIITDANSDNNNKSSLSSKTQVPPAAETKTFKCDVNLEQHHRPVSVDQARRNGTSVSSRECLPTVIMNKKKERCCRCRPSNNTRCHTSSCTCRANQRACTNCLNSDGCCNEFNARKITPDEATVVADVPLKHGTRGRCEKSSAVDLERLKIPPAHDRVKWKAFDARLSDILADEFPAEIFSTASSNELASKLSSVLYDALLDNFEKVKDIEKREPYTPKENKRLIELRKEKKELKKARQAPHRQG